MESHENLSDLISAKSGVLSSDPQYVLKRGKSRLSEDILTYHNGRERVDIVVGSGATYSVGSDRYPYTVVEILSARRIVVQADDYQRIDTNGFSESQKYDFRNNPSGPKVVLSLRRNGRWCEVGQSMSVSGYHLGHRSAYSDPSF